MFSSEIFFYLSGNVLIPEDKEKFRAWFTVTVLFFQFCCFLQQNYGLWLGFRCGLSVDPVLYHLTSQRLSLKTQSKIF